MPSDVFSFFTGSGLLDLGFADERFEIVFVNEAKKSFLNAYLFAREKLGHPEPKYGVALTSVEHLVDDFALASGVYRSKASGRKVGFIGGPPCPDFSVAGKQAGARGKNGALSQVYVDLIVAHQPDWFLFENVKGLVSTAKHRTYFDDLVSQLQAAGYATTWRLANALEYGVPQDRERVFLFGVKAINPARAVIDDFPWGDYLIHDAADIKALPWPTTTPFRDGSKLKRGTIATLTVGHWFKKNRVERHPNAEDFFTPRGGFERMQTICEGDVSAKSFKRLHTHRFSPTAAYGNNEVHLHPSIPRRLSVAEVMAIQSLPPEFVLPPEMSLTDKFKTLGNGVPYLMARGVARTVAAYLRDGEAHV